MMTTFLTWTQIWKSTILNDTGTSDKYRFSQHRVALQDTQQGNKNCSENFREQLIVTVRHSQLNLRNISLSSREAWGALERQQQEDVPKANVLAGGVHRWLSSSFPGFVFC